VEGATVGTRVLAGDVALPPGVELRTDPEYLVVNVVGAPTAEDLAEGEPGDETAPAAAGTADEQA
jgi:large subunit ribosomal protein L25